jgi:hypothetical protein
MYETKLERFPHTQRRQKTRAFALNLETALYAHPRSHSKSALVTGARVLAHEAGVCLVLNQVLEHQFLIVALPSRETLSWLS